jgi:hypothetical protein
VPELGDITGIDDFLAVCKGKLGDIEFGKIKLFEVEFGKVGLGIG